MTDLSPAAQAVLDGFRAVPTLMDGPSIAGALQAAADQLFSEPDDWTKDNMSEQGLWLLCLKRDQLLTIAAELEQLND